METFDSDTGEALKLAFEALVGDWDRVSEHAMFGHPTYKAGGTIFALLTTEAVVLTRLPEADRERLANVRDVGPFQAGDQTIESWVSVPTDPDDLEEFEFAVRASHAAALSEGRTVPPPSDDE